MQFIHAGTRNPALAPVVDGLEAMLLQRGHQLGDAPEHADLVLHHLPGDRPKSYRRRGRGVFVVGITRLPGRSYTADDLYPLLVRTMSNLLLVVSEETDPVTVNLVTPEHAHVRIDGNGSPEELYQAIYARVEPMATSRMVIDNIFEPDLEPELRAGDERTASIARAGRFLDQLNLLPAPFPIEDFLSPRELRQLKLMYGIGGLSYGNLSARLDAERFWMSASGVDKSKLETVGRDFLLVKGYDPERNAIRLSVPAGIEPRRVSVDAIEHLLIYRENPGVGAILHVHAWIEGATSTEMQYPCGTYELGRAVADLVRSAPDPDHAVIGLRNHGLTLTGSSLDEILERVSGSLLPHVPMT